MGPADSSWTHHALGTPKRSKSVRKQDFRTDPMLTQQPAELFTPTAFGASARLQGMNVNCGRFVVSFVGLGLSRSFDANTGGSVPSWRCTRLNARGT